MNATIMRTHKDALYLRLPGDKFRPVRVLRPTLQQLGARLRVAQRSILALNKHQKVGQPEHPHLRFWCAKLKALRAYEVSLGQPKTQAEHDVQQGLLGGVKKLFRLGR